MCNATVKILCYRRLGQSQCCPGSRPTQPQNPAKPLKVCPLSEMTNNNKTCDTAKLPENPYILLITNQCHVLLVFNSTCHDSYFDQQCSTLQERKKCACHIKCSPQPSDDNYEKEIRMPTPPNCNVYPSKLPTIIFTRRELAITQRAGKCAIRAAASLEYMA